MPESLGTAALEDSNVKPYFRNATVNILSGLHGVLNCLRMNSSLLVRLGPYDVRDSPSVLPGASNITLKLVRNT